MERAIIKSRGAKEPRWEILVWHFPGWWMGDLWIGWQWDEQKAK